MSALRPAGTKKRGIPHGYGFSLVSCPNYTFEILSWVTISLMTNSYASTFLSHLNYLFFSILTCPTGWLFVFVSTYQMTVWAIKKHKNYKKEFSKEYPKGRKAIFPFIL